MQFLLESDNLSPTGAVTSWEVAGMSKDSIVIKLQFLDPLFVSIGQKEDHLIVIVRNPSLFVT